MTADTKWAELIKVWGTIGWYVHYKALCEAFRDTV